MSAEILQLGQVVGTPGALDLLQANGVFPENLIHRHANHDWGTVGTFKDVNPTLTEAEMQRGAEETADDGKLNCWGVVNYGRILSVYPVGDAVVWVITEWDRSVTTILLPIEY